MFFPDFVLNGQGSGEVGQALQSCHFDPGYMRPYVDSKGRHCVTINAGFDKDGKPKYETRTCAQLMAQGFYTPVMNATTLRKQEWEYLDTVVLKAARQRLRAWSDLAGANSFGGFNGMTKMLLEHETMSDPGEAISDMDGLSEGRTDNPRFQLEGLPLPITHSDFWFSSRRLAVSRNTGTPLDTTMAEAASRRVAELIERTLIGTVTGLQYGQTSDYGRAPKVYGYTNFPSRITKTDLTTPTGSNQAAILQDVLEMRDQLYNANFYGPFMLYHSTDYDTYFDNDYILTGGNVATQTLRDRIRAIDGISDVRRLDFLPSSSNPFTMIMVQMTSDVARAVNGMEFTTIQWEGKGGMKVFFKVMCIKVPQLRADFNGNCGILHATTS